MISGTDWAFKIKGEKNLTVGYNPNLNGIQRLTRCRLYRCQRRYPSRSIRHAANISCLRTSMRQKCWKRSRRQAHRVGLQMQANTWPNDRHGVGVGVVWGLCDDVRSHQQQKCCHCFGLKIWRSGLLTHKPDQLMALRVIRVGARCCFKFYWTQIFAECSGGAFFFTSTKKWKWLRISSAVSASSAVPPFYCVCLLVSKQSNSTLRSRKTVRWSAFTSGHANLNMWCTWNVNFLLIQKRTHFQLHHQTHTDHPSALNTKQKKKFSCLCRDKEIVSNCFRMITRIWMSLPGFVEEDGSSVALARSPHHLQQS